MARGRTRVAPLGHHGAQVERRACRTRAVILLADWDAEEQHDALFAELVDRSAVTLGNRPRVALQAPNHFVHVLRRTAFNQFRVPRQIGNDDGRLTTLAFWQHLCGIAGAIPSVITISGASTLIGV